jgi:hypothetical protein
MVEPAHVHDARVRALIDLQVLQRWHDHRHGIVHPANSLHWQTSRVCGCSVALRSLPDSFCCKSKGVLRACCIPCAARTPQRRVYGCRKAEADATCNGLTCVTCRPPIYMSYAVCQHCSPAKQNTLDDGSMTAVGGKTYRNRTASWGQPPPCNRHMMSISLAAKYVVR